MGGSQIKKLQHAAGDTAAVGHLFLLDLSDNRIVSLNSDGSDRKTIVTDCRLPDGIAVDVAAGHIYWTNMGNPKVNDGSIERTDLDGQNRVTIVPPGGTFTPKQLQLERTSRKLFWCDREGMRVMCADVDGSNVETVVDTSQDDPRPGPDATKWCVGVAVDVAGGKLYWTQKGPDNAGKGRLSVQASKFPASRRRLIERISKFSMTAYPSRSIWSSIWTIASFIGPTGVIHPAATR
jgi:DNA-binding beta-propeller fold protein YncE